MTPRVAAMLLALMLLGGIGGFAIAMATDGDAPTGTAGPVTASDPSVPSTPTPSPVEVEPDSDLPPFAGPFVDRTKGFIGAGDQRVRYSIPASLVISPRTANRTYWVPPQNPEGAYSIRVDRLAPENRTTRQLVAERIAALREDDRIPPNTFEVLDSTDDTLTVTYVLFNHRSVSFIRWITVTDGTPDVEIAATGRQIDLPGLRDAVALVAATAESRPARSPKVKDPA